MVRPAIRARGVHFRYPAGPLALRGVDFDLAHGELVGILGPNGAGKSTLLKLCAGILTLDRGTIDCEEKALGAMSPGERARHVAVVPQSLRALPEISVHDFVLGGRYAHLSPWRRPRGSDRAAVARALAETDSADLAARRLTELSGGQRQRVLVARALAQETAVLLVDEPTNSLDLAHQLDVFDLLAASAAAGKAVAVVTHELNLASQYADRLVVLADGEVAAQGPPEEVLRAERANAVWGERLFAGRFPGGDRPFLLPWRGH